MGHKYPKTPIIGVGGIIIKDNTILLIKRGQSPSKGLWGVPGGCIELGETVEEGLKREVLEECGIHVSVDSLCDVFETIERDENGEIKFHYVLLDYFALHLSGKPVPGGDADECKYIPLKEIWDYDLTPGVKRLLKNSRFNKSVQQYI